jgi:hypothetical protein
LWRQASFLTFFQSGNQESVEAVLTGETTAEQAASCETLPDLIVATLSELGERLKTDTLQPLAFSLYPLRSSSA